MYNPVSAYKLFPIFSKIDELFETAPLVHTDTWQGVNIKQQIAGRMVELGNVVVHVKTPPQNIRDLRHNLSGRFNEQWAEDHFLERVCGEPINPGVQWENWPDSKSAARFLDDVGHFNHNYMERYWPRYAGKVKAPTKSAEDYSAALDQLEGLQPHTGIRGTYGDLLGVVSLLEADPYTRQAYLPIFFPEDTGIGDGGRKPCTLGYQFIRRNNELHTYYPMRSCDYYRHFGDDIYLTLRLTMWVLEQLRQRDRANWQDVAVGSLTMHCTSLHMFFNDHLKLKAQLK